MIGPGDDPLGADVFQRDQVAAYQGASPIARDNSRVIVNGGASQHLAAGRYVAIGESLKDQREAQGPRKPKREGVSNMRGGTPAGGKTPADVPTWEA